MKPGIRTSEFWLAALVAVAGVVAGFNPGHQLSAVASSSGSWAATLASAAYSFARAATKYAAAAKKDGSGGPG